MHIQNKVVLITGAVSGIGLESVKEILNDGAKGVIMVDLNEKQGNIQEEKFKKEFGENRVIFVKADITNKDEFEDAFKKAIDKYDRLDIVINNAGILDDVNYQFEINVNFTGTTTGTILGMKYMDKNINGSGGIIINVSSIAALCKNHRYTAPIYSATKTGIVTLSRGFGHKFHVEKTGVKVLAVCPGGTATPFHKHMKYLDDCRTECIRLNTGKIIQKPETVSRSIIHVIKNGTSGSVWLAEDENLYIIHDYDVVGTSKELVIAGI